MNKPSILSPRAWILFALTFLLAGCLALSEDVKPPPESQAMPRPTRAVNASPTSSSIQEEQESETTLAPPVETAGIVHVDVLNRQGEGELPPDLEVRLWGFDHMTQAYRDVQPLAEEGGVTFEDVPFAEGRLFFAEVTFKGAVYRSDIAESGSDTTDLSLSVEIFGTTTNTSALSIDRMHIFLDFNKPETLRVGEILIFSNFGDKTVVAEKEGVPILNIALPENYTNLQFQNGDIGGRFLLTEEGVGDTSDIPPGAGVHQVTLFFELPYTGKPLQIDQNIRYPLGAVIVMTPTGDVRVKSAQLEDMGLRQIEGGTIHVYAGEGIQSEASLSYTVSGAPAQATSIQEAGQGTQISNLLIGLAVFSAALIAAAVWMMRSRQEAAISLQSEDPQDAVALMDAIIALDEQYEAGDVAPDEYKQRRAALKAQLRVLTEEESPS